MGPQSPHNRPSLVYADSGEVLLDGPDGLAGTFTPDAAEETGRRLIAAADEARGYEKESGTGSG